MKSVGQLEDPLRLTPPKQSNIVNGRDEEEKFGRESEQSIKSTGKLEKYKSPENPPWKRKKKSQGSKNNVSDKVDLQEKSKLSHESLKKLLQKSEGSSVHSSDVNKGINNEGNKQIIKNPTSKRKTHGSKNESKNMKGKDVQEKKFNKIQSQKDDNSSKGDSESKQQDLKKGDGSLGESIESFKIEVGDGYRVLSDHKESSPTQNEVEIVEFSEQKDIQHNMDSGYDYIEANQLIQQPSENIEKQVEVFLQQPISVLPYLDDIVSEKYIKKDEKVMNNEHNSIARDSEEHENISERDTSTNKAQLLIKDLGGHMNQRNELNSPTDPNKVNIEEENKEISSINEDCKLQKSTEEHEDLVIKKEELVSPDYKQNKPEYLKIDSIENGTDYYFEKDRPFDSPKEDPIPPISSYEPSEDSKYQKHLSSPKDLKKEETDLYPKAIEEVGTNLVFTQKLTSEIEYSKSGVCNKDEGNQLEDSHEFSKDYEEKEEELEELEERFTKLIQNSGDKKQIKHEYLKDNLNTDGKEDSLVEESQDLKDWVDIQENKKGVKGRINIEEKEDKFEQRITEEDVIKLHEARLNNFGGISGNNENQKNINEEKQIEIGNKS